MLICAECNFMMSIVLFMNYQMKTDKPTKLLISGILEYMLGYIHSKHAVALHEGMLEIALFIFSVHQ